MFNSNHAFLVVQKLKSAPRALKYEKKFEIEKIFSICPKLLINAELYGPKAEKKDTITLGKPICNARHYLPIVICRTSSNSFPSIHRQLQSIFCLQNPPIFYATFHARIDLTTC
jgi:hypothetical protein